MIEFYVSSDTEKQKLMDIFCVAPIGKSLMERAKQYHFPPDMAKKMQTSPRIQWDEALEELLETTYLKYKNELETAHSFFHCFWDKNGEAYLSKLDSFFGERFPNYRVLLACYLDVVSNWKECNIVINHALYQKENVLYSVYSILFEMVLSQIFIKIRTLKNKTEMSDKQVWGRSELAACAILNKLYPAFQNSVKTGYPELDSSMPLFLEVIQKATHLMPFLNETINLTLPFDRKE